MISRKTRRGIMILVLLTGVSFWISRQLGDEDPQPVTGLDPSLNYVLHDFELQIFDDNGQPTLNMKAPILRNDPQLKLGTIEHPVIVLQQQGVLWDLTADTATLTADKEHIKLSGLVNVQRFERDTGNRVELNTSEIQLEVTTQTASTDQPVSLFDGRNQMDAVGMDLDMKNSKFKLKQQVKASYAVD